MNLYFFLLIILSIILSLSIEKFLSPEVDLSIHSFFSSNKTEYKPVIAIFGNSYPENDDTFFNCTYYQNSYVLWLEEFGAEVMAIHFWYNLSTIDELLNKVNGVLFMGGSRSIKKELTWEQKAIFIMEKALKTKLPIWGTCHGFQVIGKLMSTNLVLSSGYKDNPYLHALQLTEEGKDSKMFELFNDEDLEILEKKNSTIYFHSYGFTPSNWQKDKKINELFKVTSTAKDINGKEFINTFEGKNESIKFFATQFHPEKNPYKRYNYQLEHNMESLRVSQLLGMKFVDEARKNKNRFESSKNNEGDRKGLDFFDTYQGNPNAEFDKNKETYYFSRNKNKNLK